MHFLTDNTDFPEVTKANEDGLLAIGGNLSVERLLNAYKKGISKALKHFFLVLKNEFCNFGNRTKLIFFQYKNQFFCKFPIKIVMFYQ